jgi:hypothetical protein
MSAASVAAANADEVHLYSQKVCPCSVVRTACLRMCDVAAVRATDIDA